MSLKSKNIVMTTVAGSVFLAIYAVYITRPENLPDSVQGWAISMLVFLGLAILTLMVLQIVFLMILAARISVTEGEQDSGRIKQIVNATMAEDEMDRLINLRAARVGYVVAGFGFVGVLVTLAFGLSAIVALHVLFWSIAFGSYVSAGVSIYGYERGVRRA